MDKANKAMFPLIDTIFKFEMTAKQSVKLFSSLVKPILLYGSEIWGSLSTHQIKVINDDPNQLGNYILTSNIEKSQLKFCKQILGLKRNCPSLAVLGELGLSPITLTSFIRSIRYWHRLTQMDEECLANKALRTTKNSLGELSCWYSTVKTILNLIGLTDLWEHPSRYSTNRVHALCKEKLNFFFQQFWKNELHTADKDSICNRKLRSYKLFKDEFKMEPYTTSQIPLSLKKLLSKFRCSDHDLHIERGRHKGLPVEQRLCTMCTNNAIEDEAHFLTECPAYHEFRMSLLTMANINSLPTNLQFIQLMRNKSEPVIYALAKFLKKALKI